MRIDRFGAQDCEERLHPRLVALLRSKTPEEKLQMTLDRIEFMRDLRERTKHLRQKADEDGFPGDR